MSLITTVGRRSWRTRFLVGAVYLLLSLGAVTMVVPFLLMGSMATTSEGDFREFRMIPEYWTNDQALFRKVLVDAAKLEVSSVWGGSDRWFSPTDVRPEDFTAVAGLPATLRRAQTDDLDEFLRTACPPRYRMPLFVPNPDSPFNARVAYQQWLQQKYGTVEAVNRAHADNAAQWKEFELPEELAYRKLPETPRVRDYRTWVETLPPNRVTLFSTDATVLAYLKTIRVPDDPRLPHDDNGQLVLSRITYDDLERAPFTLEQRKQFFRERAALRFAQIDVALAGPAWTAWLAQQPGAPKFPLTPLMPDDPQHATLWARFIQQDCPAAALSMDRPEKAWRAFLLEKYGSLAAINAQHGTNATRMEAVTVPYLAALYDHFVRDAGEVRQRYFTHNFRTVIEFVAVHGQAMQNTIILILLTIAGTLTVNPMAAYALSRFRLKESHQVLVFLLATMAFPGEVLMIPGFLQIKRFPMAELIGAAVCLLAIAVGFRLLHGIRPWVRNLLALGLTLGVAFFIAPRVADVMGLSPSVSLMNTFWALVLPGLASGYGIFLLKGFFDSLPPELYEAGLLDGASETTMFLRITLPLCKPILAVMALGSFTAAYGAFMHAFLVAQDPRMWTLMVFLYEFQQSRTLPMVMASLVIAAIPTLIMFILCQRVILRGIVIPTYK